MTINQNVGTDVGSGAGSTPSEPVSPSESKPIEGDVSKLLADFGKRLEGIEKGVGGLREVQGNIDRSQSAFRDQLARLSQYKAQGLDDNQALAEMEADDAADNRWKSLEQKIEGLAARLAGAGTQADGQQAVTKVFETVGLDVKDPRVASALMKQYANPDEVELTAYRLLNQISQSPNPTTAQSASLPGGGAQGSSAQLDAVYAQYEEAAKHPTKNAALLQTLETQMKELGG